MKVAVTTFPFSRCLGRKRKPNPPQLDERDKKMSFHAAEASPGTSSADSGSTKVTSEVEPKKLQNFDSAMGTPISLKSTGKKSYCSSVISRSSASFSQFCQSSSSVEPLPALNDCRLSIDFGWPTPQLKPKMLSGALNLQIKPMEFSLDRSLTIHEEGEEPVSARPHSYSDDPFAPPTPRGATYTSSHHRDSRAESEITMGPALTTRPHQIEITEARHDVPILSPSSPLQEPQLPTIARVSKLSFDWILELPPSPVAPYRRSRLPSITKGSPLGSPLTNYRTPMGTNVINTPRTPNSQTYSPSRNGDTNQVPFPEYP